MKSHAFLTVLLICCLSGCKESPTPPSHADPLVGEWVWNLTTGMVDSLDPANPFFQNYSFMSDNSFKGTAYYVDTASGGFVAYKYVMTGSYRTSSDSLLLRISMQIYASWSDSIQSEPAPATVSPYTTGYRYIITGVLLGFIYTSPGNNPDTMYFFKKR